MVLVDIETGQICREISEGDATFEVLFQTAQEDSFHVQGIPGKISLQGRY